MYHFHHIAAYYWHKYLNRSYSAVQRTCSGHSYSIMAELSDDEDAFQQLELDQDELRLMERNW